MNNQRKVLEIFIYILLLCAGLYFMLSDSDDDLFTKKKPSQYKTRQEKITVPQEYIDYDYDFMEGK